MEHSPSRNLDQHFLVDGKTAKRIVEWLEVGKDDVVLEIGPGKGALTKEIPKCKKIIVVERDARLIDELKLIEGIEVIHANILDVIPTLSFTKILSNTPYAIIEPLFKKMFPLKFELAIIVVGEGTWEHLSQKTLLGLLAKSHFDIKMVGGIRRDMFDPAPKINSSILMIKKLENPGKKELFVQKLWRQNDKLLKNALRGYFVECENLTKKQAAARIEALQLPDKLLDKLVSRLVFKEWENMLLRLF